MSSWIPSFFNPNPDPDRSSDEDNTSPITSSSPKTPSAGVKEDLSAVFRGVAAFLAPRPTTSFSLPSSSSSDAIAGIRNDLAEIQGSFKSGISLISSKLTSNLLQFQNQINEDDDDDEEEDDEEEEEDTVGITEEIVGFVRKLSMRPELWTDFPLSLADDFDLSEYQREHAENIDHFVPELVTLREKICSQMSEEKFWIIYFILLFPRLSEEDLKLLSTPQILELRETLLNKLQNKSDSIDEKPKSPETSDSNKESGNKLSISEGEEHQPDHKNVGIVNAMEQTDTIKNTEEYDSDSHKEFKNEEDISFSDLEDDDENESLEKLTLNETSKSDKGKESEGEDSSGWTAVDDKDFDNLGAI